MANANQIVVGSNGKVWVAAIGASAPTTASAAMPAGWTDLGYTTEDGATFTDGKDTTAISVWQSFYPARYIVNARMVSVVFSMRQWNNATVQFALGGSIAANGVGEWTYTPPSPEVLDFRQFVLEWFDSIKSYRLYIRRGLVTENVESNLTRTDSAVLPITYSAMDPGGGSSIYSLFTNDSAFSLSA